MRLALLLGLALPGGAAALPLEPPPGATLAFEEAEAPASHALAIGPAEGADPPLSPREGAVTRRVWQVPDPGTSLALLAPLRAQVEAQGLTVLLDCDARACGGFDFRAAVEVLPPPAMFVDLGDFRYLAAEGGGTALSLLVSRSGALGFVQAIEVGPAAAAAAAAPPDATDTLPDAAPPGPPADPAALAARLEAQGRAVLEGLAFASGSATLASGGDATLAALAAWLAADPARRVAIVGHTDATGALDANIALSRRRAEAVAARLRASPGVASAQVEAGGMGYLAPLAPHAAPGADAINRRVEAVVLP